MTGARQRTGKQGERLAADHLRQSGYKILDRNFRTRHGELDLVAADARGIVFCEVKTRRTGTGGPPSPLDAVGMRKRRQLRRMASEWLARSVRARRGPGHAELRFDAIGIWLGPDGRVLGLEHIENAF